MFRMRQLVCRKKLCLWRSIYEKKTVWFARQKWTDVPRCVSFQGVFNELLWEWYRASFDHAVPSMSHHEYHSIAANHFCLSFICHDFRTRIFYALIFQWAKIVALDSNAIERKKSFFCCWKSSQNEREKRSSEIVLIAVLAFECTQRQQRALH